MGIVLPLLRLYLPLALSFELMMLEGPSVQWAIGRLPQIPTNLAAWGLTMQLSLLIESPVIMLLATATALVKNTDTFLALRTFMLRIALGCTLVTAAIAFTPLLDFICLSLLGQPTPIVEASRLPLQLMLLWSAAIAWRRFHQGVLVRQGRTALVTYGTAIRLASVVLPALALVAWGKLSGAATAAIAIMVGVLAEALSASSFARSVIRALPTYTDDGDGDAPLTQKAITKFHTPLAMTTLLTLAAQPITSAAIARLPFATQTLAAAPVMFSALLLLRGWGFAVQEITVAQLKKGTTPEATLSRFASLIGVATTLATLLLALTPFCERYASALGVPADLHSLVRQGILWGALLPLIAAISSFVRGVLVARQHTQPIYRGMALGLTIQVLVLVAGVVAKFPALPLAALAFTLGGIAETAYLMAAMKKAASF
jgi:hypothetical protein